MNEVTPLFILLLVHFLADFYFQSEAIAREKMRKTRYLILHSTIYAALLCLGAFLPFRPLPALLPVVVLSVTHFLIDWLKILYDRHYEKPWNRFGSFCVDQALHIGLICIAYFGCLQFVPVSTWWDKMPFLGEFLDECIACVLIMAVCLKPPAILVGRLLDCFGHEKSNADTLDKGGYVIGLLERFVVVILILNGYIGEIAFVLTAKSVARFKEFEKEGFAEKFLIGTMASIAFALAASLLLLSLHP